MQQERTGYMLYSFWCDQVIRDIEFSVVGRSSMGVTSDPVDVRLWTHKTTSHQIVVLRVDHIIIILFSQPNFVA